MMRVLLACVIGLWTSSVLGQDFIVTDGPLSDDDFYNLVSCEAEPGTDCTFEPVRWSERDASDLTVSILDVAESFQHYALADEALDIAVSEINAAGGSVQLRRLPDGEEAHVTLYLSGIREGEPISGIGLRDVDGAILQGAYVHIFWNGARELTRGLIIMAQTLEGFDIQPIILEEVTQSLGLLTDIRNPWYETRSVFSEDSNMVTRLGKQDAMVIRRHYPASN